MEQPDHHITPLRSPRRRSRRSVRLNRIIAGITWTLGALVLIFEVWAALRGQANVVNVINTIFVVIGTALGGILALSGDGDVILFTGTDEGQRDAIVKAAMPAFSISFWGLFVLWIAYQFRPDWRATADIQIGILLLLTLVTYLAGYVWQRRGA